MVDGLALTDAVVVDDGAPQSQTLWTTSTVALSQTLWWSTTT